MKVIKNINNNAAICETSTGVEVVALGKGIGFQKPPYEIQLSRIERTFYDVDEIYVQLINEIPEQILEIAAKTVDYASNVLDSPMESNLVFTLADHINFAIKRYKENLAIKLPILYDVEHLFEEEAEIGKKALELIYREMKIYLPKEEAASIALHIVNSEAAAGNREKEQQADQMLEDITRMIEAYFSITIDRSGFNYSRYAMHVRYLIQRGRQGKLIENEDMVLYHSLSEALQETEQCVAQISSYFEEKLGCELTAEERMYLMLYTNRLCTREDHDL